MSRSSIITNRSRRGGVDRARDRAAPLDLIVANAGVSGGMGESANDTRRIFSVNLDGVLNTVLPALSSCMRPRKSSHIAHRQLPRRLSRHRWSRRPTAAPETAVRVWGEGLRGALAPENIGVTVVCPGFVVSRMTAINKFPMPFLMDADRAARIIQNGIAANRGRVAFPWPTWALVWLLAMLPDSWAEVLARAAPGKE